jgi:hypothetical protein
VVSTRVQQGTVGKFFFFFFFCGKSNLCTLRVIIPITTTQRKITLTTNEYMRRWLMRIEENLISSLTWILRVDKDIGNPLGTK